MASANDLVEHLALIYRDQGPAGVIRNLSFLYAAFVLTGEDGRIVGASDEFCSLVGYSHNELIGLEAAQLVTADERGPLRQRFACGSEQRYELKLLTRSEELRYARVTPHLLHIDDRTVRLAEFVDITGASLADRATRESEEKFRTVFELAAVGIARLKPDGSWLECNGALTRILGYSEDELQSMTFQDVTHPDDLATDLAFVGEMLAAQRQHYSMQKRYIHKQGHIVWANLTVSLVWDETGEPAYFVSLIDDITALKNAQHQLEHSAEIFRGLADSLPIAVAVHGPAETGSACRYLNPRFSEMFGYTLHDLPTLADWWPRAFPEEAYRRRVTGKWLRLARDSNRADPKALSLETLVACKDGRTRPVRWTFANRDATHYAFGLDITAEMQLEANLTQENAHLEHLSLFDELTGIANRRLFDQRLAAEWNRARRHRSCLSLIMVDIDFFKSYNDRYGHVAGDRCLAEVARVLAGTLNRGTDMVARYGGEEFVILLPDTAVAQATVIAENCREGVIERKIEHAASPLGPVLTVSLGVAGAIPGKEDQAVTLLSRADDLLYDAKDAGRNRVAAESEVPQRQGSER